MPTMKTKRIKKESRVSIKIDSALRKKIVGLAQTERRSLGDQAIFLMEKGLAVLEQAEAAKTAEKAAESA